MADLTAAATPSLRFYDALTTPMADLAAATPSLQFYEALATRMADVAAAAAPSLQFYEALQAAGASQTEVLTRMADLAATGALALIQRRRALDAIQVAARQEGSSGASG